MQPGDLELVRAAGHGDHAAFHALVDRHAQDLFRLALSLTPTRADAEDLLQETFAGAYRSLGRFNAQSSVRTWLTSILMRQAAKAWHKSRHNRKTASLDAPSGGTRASGNRADDTADAYDWVDSARTVSGQSGQTVSSHQAAVDQRLDLDQILARLDPPHREILLLREMQQLTYEEIAASLGVPRGTVESRLHRARAELRRHLKDYRPPGS